MTWSGLWHGTSLSPSPVRTGNAWGTPPIGPIAPFVAGRLAGRPLEWMMQVASSASTGATVVLGKQQIMRIQFVSRLRARCRACGFTLVELMVTLAIAAILAMIAVPSFRNLILSNRLTTSANAIVDALNTARMDAIKLNATTQFCSNIPASNNTDPLGAACGTSAGAVAALPQGATSAGVVRASSLNLDSQIKLSGTVIAIRFSGQGFGYAATGNSSTPYSGGTVAIVCSPVLSSNNRRVVSMTGGSIITTTTTTGSCQ